MSSSLLKFSDVRVQIDGAVVLDLPQLDVFTHSQTALFLGANGAGKSSLLNAVTGYAPLSRQAKLTLQNDEAIELSKLSPGRIVKAGIARTFQRPLVFPSLSVEDSLLIAAHAGWNFGRVQRLFSFLRPPRAFAQARHLVDTLLEEFNLDKVRRKNMSELTFGALRLVELARALATQPRVIFLDEPTSGAGPQELEFLTWMLSTGLPDLVKRLQVSSGYRFTSLAVGLVTHERSLLEALNAGVHPGPVVYAFDRGRLASTNTLADWLKGRKDQST